METQINNLQNSKISGPGIDNTNAQIDHQIINYIINFKFKKINRYEIINLIRKQESKKQSKIQIFDIKKIRTELKTLLNIHVFCIFSFYLAIVIAMLIYINILPLNYSFIVFTSVVLSILSYFTLYVKSNHKKYTKALININLNNLKNIKIINDKTTNYIFYNFSFLYFINHIVEPYYNYYAYAVLVDQEDNETYLHLKTHSQYVDFKALVKEFYEMELITD